MTDIAIKVENLSKHSTGITNQPLMEADEVKKKLKQAFWDYNYSADDLYKLLYDQVEVENLSLDRLYKRLLETYSWYKIMDIVPQAQWMDLLSEPVISKLRSKTISDKYRHVRRILYRATVSTAR